MSRIHAQCLSVLLTGALGSLASTSFAAPNADAILRGLQGRVPAVEAAAPDLDVGAVAGHYTAQATELERETGGFLGGNDLHLFSNQTYLYVEWADIESDTIYDRGRWSLHSSIVTLASDHTRKPRSGPDDRTFLIFKYAVGAARGMRLIGTREQLAYFAAHAAETPILQLLINSREQVEHYTAERSKAVYADLMKRVWRPN